MKTEQKTYIKNLLVERRKQLLQQIANNPLGENSKEQEEVVINVETEAVLRKRAVLLNDAYDKFDTLANEYYEEGVKFSKAGEHDKAITCFEKAQTICNMLRVLFDELGDEII